METKNDYQQFNCLLIDALFELFLTNFLGALVHRWLRDMWEWVSSPMTQRLMKQGTNEKKADLIDPFQYE